MNHIQGFFIFFLKKGRSIAYCITFEQLDITRIIRCINTHRDNLFNSKQLFVSGVNLSCIILIVVVNNIYNLTN